MAKTDEKVPETQVLEKYEMPPVIMKADEYDKAYRYLAARYHMLSPVSAFSGMAPQHGLVVAKVMLDADPAHGEVYQDGLFCKKGGKDPLDDEVAIAKVGLRKLALAGGWNLSADVLMADRNYWVIRGNSRFVGLDGSVQTFSATVEYDLRDGSPQIRNMTPKQVEAARSHGLRGGEARALNAACREYGIKQKYTRRELMKPFVVMRMMFIPDASNEMQMRMVTERALQGTAAMFPQTQTQAMEPIEGMKAPIDTSAATPEPEPIPGVPQGFVLLRKLTVEVKKKKDGTGTFKKWRVIDSNGEESVTIKSDFGKALLACWNEADWTKGRPVEIVASMNNFRENEIQEINPLPVAVDDEDVSQLPLQEEEP